MSFCYTPPPDSPEETIQVPAVVKEEVTVETKPPPPLFPPSNAKRNRPFLLEQIEKDFCASHPCKNAYCKAKEPRERVAYTLPQKRHTLSSEIAITHSSISSYWVKDGNFSETKYKEFLENNCEAYCKAECLALVRTIKKRERDSGRITQQRVKEKEEKKKEEKKTKKQKVDETTAKKC